MPVVLSRPQDDRREVGLIDAVRKALQKGITPCEPAAQAPAEALHCKQADAWQQETVWLAQAVPGFPRLGLRASDTRCRPCQHRCRPGSCRCRTAVTSAVRELSSETAAVSYKARESHDMDRKAVFPAGHLKPWRSRPYFHQPARLRVMQARCELWPADAVSCRVNFQKIPSADFWQAVGVCCLRLAHALLSTPCWQGKARDAAYVVNADPLVTLVLAAGPSPCRTKLWS